MDHFRHNKIFLVLIILISLVFILSSVGEINAANLIYCDGGVPSETPVTNDEKIYTALGCVPVGTTTKFIEFALVRALSVGGGLTFLLIIYASYRLMTSTGDPKKVGAAKDLITASLGGLVLIIFSLFFLRTVGLEILHLPGI